MDLGERYKQLSLLGRQTFLDVVAQGALVTEARVGRIARGTAAGQLQPSTKAITEEQQRAPLKPWMHDPGATRYNIMPLCKKMGTPFVDLITIGRTPSNDITLPDISVSRFQAFFRQRLGHWMLCDAGSRNGTFAGSQLLKARTEYEVKSGDTLQFGSVRTVFHTADSLFDLLSRQ